VNGDMVLRCTLADTGKKGQGEREEHGLRGEPWSERTPSRTSAEMANQYTLLNALAAP
jgi:hypothetical protein